MNTAIELRRYQRAAVDAVHAAAQRSIQRPLVAMATGLGKSLCAAYVVKERTGRAVVLAHRDELIRQLARSVTHANPEAKVGIVKAEENEVWADVVVASLQTLARPARLDALITSQRASLLFGDPRPFVTVISDESHHVTAGEDENTFGAVLRGLGAFTEGGPLTVGWTATPERGDGKALGSMWQEICFEMGILDGIAQGYLCDLRAKQVQLACDFSKLHTRAGDFRDDESEQLLMEADAPRHAANAYLQHAPGRKALVFTPTVAVAQAMAQAFRAVGVAAEAAHGDMPLDDRRALLARFKSGATRVVSNAQLLTEGYDEPSVDAIVMARPTRSRPFALQMLGRGTRIFPGKQDCIVLDLVGSISRMDLVTVASLFNVSPQAAEGGVFDAVRSKAKAGAAHRQEIATEGRLVAVDVALFAKRSFAWVNAGVRFILSLGEEGNLSLEPSGVDPDAWDVFKVRRERKPGAKWPITVRSKLYAGLSLTDAQGASEDIVRKSGATRLNAKDAPWRKDPASPDQIKHLRGRYREGMSKGEAHDLLSVIFAR